MSARTRDGLIALAAALGLSVALLYALRFGGLGFPLDDAWIHQTYARNLARSGQWAFVEGTPSAGSTAPLWTLLLAPGYLLGIEYHIWMYLLGFGALAATGLGAARLAMRLNGQQRTFGRYAPLLVGLAVVMEWHMVWAAGSGMETALFTALVVWLWWWTLRSPDEDGLAPPDWRHGLVLGLLGGALTLTRPEGIVVLGLAGLYSLFRWRERAFVWGVGAAVGFAIFFVPYLALNVSLSGTLWPNTASAKQIEYAIFRQSPYVLRFGRMWVAEGGPLIGAQVLLLPGLVIEVMGRVRARDWRGLFPLAWAVGHTALYAWRLPVTYQHGRYIMPVVPVIVLYGALGVLRVARPSHSRIMPRLLSRSWLVSLAVMFPVFLFVLGAPAYARDVRVIETEMVATARWLEANTGPDALVAAHDIGAVGYFSERPLIDLAGLVSPEVISIIRDEEALLTLIEREDAEYLVTFPGWYPDIVADPRVCEVFTTGGEWSPILGGENMSVYALHWRAEECPAAP
jgi:hypothetical protein